MNKVRYVTNKVNQEYIMIDVRYELVRVLLNEETKLSNRIEAEINNIYGKFYGYEKEQKKGFIMEAVNIRKDSVLGEYILEHDELFFDDANDITYDKVVNAYNVSVFENNEKMSNKIMVLFKNRISGTREELCEVINPNVLDYIAENCDFKFYLDKKDGKVDDKEYLVFEDGEYVRKKLSDNPKVKSK